MAATLTLDATHADAAERLALSRAALGAAGHEVTDTFLLDLLAQKASGEISMEELVSATRRHVQG